MATFEDLIIAVDHLQDDVTTLRNSVTGLTNTIDFRKSQLDSAVQEATLFGLETVLSGYTVGANTAIVSTDNILQAFQKTQGQIDNRPNVSIGTANGLTLSGQQISLELSSSIKNGALSSTDWTTFNNKQNTLSLTTVGNSGASTLVGDTLNIPNYTLSGLGGVPTSRTLTINGTSFDLSADRSWTISAGIAGTIANGQVAFGSGTNTVAGSSTFTFSPTAQLLLNNSVTASSAIARGINFTPILVAAANNDVLVGLDINPTFTNGAFTGVSNIPFRITGGTLLGNTLRSISLKLNDQPGDGVIAMQGGGWGL